MKYDLINPDAIILPKGTSILTKSKKKFILANKVEISLSIPLKVFKKNDKDDKKNDLKKINRKAAAENY